MEFDKNWPRGNESKVSLVAQQMHQNTSPSAVPAWEALHLAGSCAASGTQQRILVQGQCSGAPHIYL